MSEKIREVAKTLGVSEPEALKQLLEDDVELIAKATEKFVKPKTKKEQRKNQRRTRQEKDSE